MFSSSPVSTPLRALPALLLASLAACSGPKHAEGILAENVMAHPPELVAAVIANPASPLPDALRALGVPFVRIGPSQLPDLEKEPYRIVLLDEGAIEDEQVRKLFNGLIELSRRTGLRLIVMHQETDPITELATTSRSPLRARTVPYQVTIESPSPQHAFLRYPNQLSRPDLDSLARNTTQLAHAADALAVLAGNLDNPDESAALLQLPVSRGTLIYLSIPIAARAAEGRVAEQRLLGNLVSMGEE